MTDQTGQQFDSTNLAGKPFAVSFFFASCPSICRDLNAQIQRLSDQLRSQDFVFVSVSVDPENDTVPVLKRYAQDFEATPDRWLFLTGQPYQVRQLGEQNFGVVVDKETHTDNLLLVDRWGRYRDRFKWDDPYDMKRFLNVAKEVLSESQPPLDAVIRTRNVMAGTEPADVNLVPWIREFHLVERSGEKFFSRDLTGQIWIGNFFFTSCPGICKQQVEYLRGLEDRLKRHPAIIVSITTDPTTDTPEKLRQFARGLDADPKRWLFLTGPDQLIRRIASEFFSSHASPDHHSSRLYVVDRWGNVRGDFDWQQADEEAAMLQLVDQLNEEQVPPARLEHPAGAIPSPVTDD
jgi:cytochrome oxidase Cu insertion factor (SCO1/SenC/PrrC family)